MILIDESPSWRAIIFAVYVDLRSCTKSTTETVYVNNREASSEGVSATRCLVSLCMPLARQYDVPHTGGELLAG